MSSSPAPCSWHNCQVLHSKSNAFPQVSVEDSAVNAGTSDSDGSSMEDLGSSPLASQSSTYLATCQIPATPPNTTIFLVATNTTSGEA